MIILLSWKSIDFSKMPCVHDQALHMQQSKPLLALVALISYGRIFTEWQGCIDTAVGQGGG